MAGTARSNSYECTTKAKVDSTVFKWNIENFSLCEENFDSDIFTDAGGYQWKLKFTKNSDCGDCCEIPEDNHHVYEASLVLVVDPKHATRDSGCVVGVTSTVLDGGIVVPKALVNASTGRLNVSQGIPIEHEIQILKRVVLKSRGSGYRLPNDRLTLHVQVDRVLKMESTISLD